MYEHNLRGFTYYGHGDAGDPSLPESKRTKGALYPRSPNVYMDSAALAEALNSYINRNRNACPARLDYMRLFSCWSGCAQWDVNASVYGLPERHTFRQSFQINPPGNPSIKTKVKTPKKMWTTTGKVYGFPGLNKPLD